MIIPDHIPKYNQSVNYSVNLDCSPKDTWSIISTKSHLELFHPFCEKNPVKKWPGKGAIAVSYTHLTLPTILRV